MEAKKQKHSRPKRSPTKDELIEESKKEAIRQMEKEKTKTFKLPSQAEIMKNPMKYIGQAVQTFEKLTKQVEDQGKAIVLISKHIQESDKKLAPLVNAIEQSNAARAQGPATPAGPTPAGAGGLGQIMQLLPLLSGGGGGNPMMEAMMKKMVERSILGMDLSNALTKAMIIKIAPELANTLTKDIVKKE